MLPTFDDGSCNNTFAAQARPTPQAQAQNRPTPPSTPNVQPGPTGTTNQNGRGDGDCAARNIAHIDFEQIFCTDANGFIFAYVGSGGVVSPLIESREIWGARPNNFNSFQRDVTHIVMHHTVTNISYRDRILDDGTRTVAQAVRNIDSDHGNRGWGGVACIQPKKPQ